MTKIKKLLDETVGDVSLKLEVIEAEPGLHDYGVNRMAWLRGVKFMNNYGADQALELIDERAIRTADRGDYDTVRRWRTLITAIHAMQEDEQLPGNNTHYPPFYRMCARKFLKWTQQCAAKT